MTKLTKICKDCNDFAICIYDGSTDNGENEGCDLWKPPFDLYQTMTEEEIKEIEKL